MLYLRVPIIQALLYFASQSYRPCCTYASRSYRPCCTSRPDHTGRAVLTRPDHVELEDGGRHRGRSGHCVSVGVVAREVGSAFTEQNTSVTKLSITLLMIKLEIFAAVWLLALLVWRYL